MRFQMTICLAFLVLGCASNQNSSVSKEAESRDKATGEFLIGYRVLSSDDMNFSEGTASSAMICFYQMTDKVAISELIESNEGTRTLLECKNFDYSVVGSTPVYIQPSRKVEGEILRFENALFLAVVVGYWNTRESKNLHIFEFPTELVTRGSLWWKEETYEPKKLILSFVMDSNSFSVQASSQSINKH